MSNTNEMDSQALFSLSNLSYSLKIGPIISAFSIAILILFCIMVICIIISLFIVLLLYIICEWICRPLSRRYNIDLELGRSHQARIVTYRAIFPQYLPQLQLLDPHSSSKEEKLTMRKQVLEKLLPPVIFGSEHAKKKYRDCAICLNDYANGEACRVFPLCNHMFHLDCIDKWLKNHLTCPVCRKCILDL